MGVLLVSGTLLWADPLGNSLTMQQSKKWLRAQIDCLKAQINDSENRCKELEQENLKLKEQFDHLNADIAGVEEALGLPVRGSDEPDSRLENIRIHVKNYYVSFRTKKLAKLSKEDWELINFSLEEREELRELIRDYENFVKKYSGKKIIILED